MASIDLIDFQVGRRKEMRLYEGLGSSRVSSCQQGARIDGDSCGFLDHVNEYDDKLKTFTIQEEDQRSVLIIGGIRIFLPDSPVEAIPCEEGQPVVTVMMKEKISKVV
jgi:hypothetical protein